MERESSPNLPPLLKANVGITSSLDVGVIGARLGIGARPEIGANSPASLPASLFQPPIPASPPTSSDEKQGWEICIYRTHILPL